MKQSVTTIFIFLAMIAMPSVSAFAASLDDIFDEFKDCENVEYVKIPRFLMWLAKFADDDDSPAAKKINGMKVLSFSKTTSSVKTKFDKRFVELSDGMDLMLSASDNDDNVRIFTRIKGDKFKDIYIYAADKEEIALIKFSGTFTADDVKELADEQKNKKKH